jgi:acetyl esterase/lipase
MNKKKPVICSVLLIFSILVAFFSTMYQTGLSEEQGSIGAEDIVYGKGGDLNLELNLARPAIGKGPFPALIFMHGSGWGYYRGIGRSQYNFAIRQAAKRGYVAITIDYRLTSMRENGKVKYTFPAQVYDAKCAVRWLRVNARKYRVDPNRIGAIGWSSGGHLALMLGFTDPSDGLEGNCGNQKYSSRVQAVVSLAGPVELKSKYYESVVKQPVVDFLGGTPEEVPELYELASPVNYITEDDPPVLIINGDSDNSVPLQQAELLDRKLSEAGVPHTLIIKEGVGHQNFYDDEAVWNFFDKYLKED